MRIMKKYSWVMAFLLIAGLLLVGCGSAEPTPVPTEEPAVAPTEEPALEPTEEPTATPTDEPEPPVEAEPVEETEVVVVAVREPGTYDFEDGTTQGWEPRGETAVTISTDTANSGSHSILVTDRMETRHGAAVSVVDLLDPDKTYKISGYVRVADGEPQSQFVLTMQRTPAGEETVSEWIASSALLGGDEPAWVRFGGEYSFSGDVDEMRR